MKLSTQLSIHPKYWNKKNQRVKKSCPESKHFNGVLDKLETKVKKEILSFNMLDKDWLMHELKKRIKGQFTSQQKK